MAEEAKLADPPQLDPAEVDARLQRLNEEAKKLEEMQAELAKDHEQSLESKDDVEAAPSTWATSSMLRLQRTLANISSPAVPLTASIS